MVRTLLRGGARVAEHRLSNGLRVLVAERHGDPVVASVLFYGVGARHEREHEAGVSHFLEHMMFKGSRRFGKGEIDRLTTELGGANNAFTSNDHTAYWFELASDRWEKALEVEADRMQHLAIDPAEFRSEREVVLEELSMGEDEPWRVLGRRVEAALFGRHPYGRPVIGFADALRALEPDDMRDYYARHYRPDNAVLVLAGDLDSAQALASARRHFESIEPGPRRASRPRGIRAPRPFAPELERLAGGVELSITWGDPLRRLCLAWQTASVGTHDDLCLDLASVILAGGRTSSLQRRLVHEERTATSISVSNDTRVEGGIFWIFAEVAQGADPARVLRSIDEEMARLAGGELGRSDLARARSMLVSSEAFAAESVSDVAEELGEAAIDHDWRSVLDGCAGHVRLGAHDVVECVARLLHGQPRVVGWCVPEDEPAPTARSVARSIARSGGRSAGRSA